MITSNVIRALLTRAIQGIAEVTAEATVTEYTEQDNGDLFSTINELRPTNGILLIVSNGFEPSGHQMQLLRHPFSIIVRTVGDPHVLVGKLLNGVTAASGFDPELTLLNLTIHPRYHQMETPRFMRQSIPVDEKSNFDYWELTTAFLSRAAE